MSTGALEGPWEATTEQGVSLSGPTVPFSAQQQAGQWLGPSQTSPPSLNFSTTGWAPPMEQPRSTPSSRCSDYPGGHSYTTAPNPTSFTATRQATPTGHAFHHTSSALGKPIPRPCRWEAHRRVLSSVLAHYPSTQLLCAFAISEPLESSFTPFRSKLPLY